MGFYPGNPHIITYQSSNLQIFFIVNSFVRRVLTGSVFGRDSPFTEYEQQPKESKSDTRPRPQGEAEGVDELALR